MLIDDMNFQSYIASLIRNPNQTWVFKPYKPLRLNGSTTLPNVGVGLFWFLSSEKHGGKHASFMNHESCLFTGYECTWDCLNCITCWGPKVNYVNLYCLHRSVRLPMENTIEPLIFFLSTLSQVINSNGIKYFFEDHYAFSVFFVSGFLLFFIFYFLLYIYIYIFCCMPFKLFMKKFVVMKIFITLFWVTF